MGFWGKLFGSEKVLSSSIKLVDNLWFSKQEKVENWNKLLQAYEPFKIAQRLLALIIGIPFAVIHVLASGLMFASVFIENSDKMLNIAKLIISNNNETLGHPLSIILYFYFGGGLLEGGIRVFKTKLNKK